MSFVDVEVLKSVVGAQSSGPAGFGISYEVESGATIDASNNTVEVKLNEQSLASARAQNEGGANKLVAQSLIPAPKASSALSFIAGRQEKTDSQYFSMFAKRGLTSSTGRGLSPAPQWGQRRDYRTALAAKSPLLRIKQRHLLQLRKTFDEIASYKKKTVAVNPENLPRRALEKIVEAALSKGQQNTLLGALPQAVKAVGYNANAWKRWSGALIDGSYPSATPRPRAG